MSFLMETETTNDNENSKSQRQYQCFQCSRTFQRPEHMKRHARIHTGSRPFHCTICSASFARSDLLSRHQRTLHSGQGKRRQPNTSLLARSARASLVDDQRKSLSISPGSSSNGECASNDFSNNTTTTAIAPDIIPTTDSSTNPSFTNLNNNNGQQIASSNTITDPAAIAHHHQDNDFFQSFLPFDTSFTNLFEFNTNSDQFINLINFNPDLTFPKGDIIPQESQQLEHDQIPHQQQIQHGQPRSGEEEDRAKSSSSLSLSSSSPSSPSTTTATAQPEGGGGDGGPTIDPVEFDDHLPDYNSSIELAAIIPQPSTVNISQVSEASKTLRTNIPPNGNNSNNNNNNNNNNGNLTRAEPLLAYAKLSQHAITRYVKGFIDGFARHAPIFHMPSFDIYKSNRVLALSILTLGSKYIFETNISARLFRLAHDSLMAELERDVQSSDLSVTISIFLLMVYSTWSCDPNLIRSAFIFQSMLVNRLRKACMTERINSQDLSWTDWIHIEQTRRTIFASFAVFTMQCIGLDVTPPIGVGDLNVELPCFQDEWEARTESEWLAIHRTQGQPKLYDCLCALQSQSTLDNIRGSVSEYGCCILISATVQNIYLARQSMSNNVLMDNFMDHVRILRNWQVLCSRFPNDEKTPHLINGSSLMRFAYIRLNIDFGPVKAALTYSDAKDNENIPLHVARVLNSMEPIKLGEESLRAAEYACNALSIPLRIGIDLCARTQAFVWSMQHCLCSFECALLLSGWMSVVLKKPSKLITNDEMKVLKKVDYLLKEGGCGGICYGRKACAEILRLWAKLFRGTVVWKVIGLMGEVLMTVATEIEKGTTSFFP